MARKSKEKDSRTWGNFKIPIQTHYKCRVIEIFDMEETKKKDSKLRIKFVCNWYDTDEEGDQASFWFIATFIGDAADRHEKHLDKGDLILVEPVMPVQVSTSDESEYVNFSMMFPRLDYLVVASFGEEDDDDEEEEEERPTRRSRRSRSKSKSSSQNGSGTKKRKSRRRSKTFFDGE